jgi:hypothetical protein
MKHLRSLLAGMIAASLVIGHQQASASQSSALNAESSEVIKVGWHGYGGWGHGGWGWGPWPWFGLGAGIVAGAIIADQAYRPRPGHYYDEGPYDGPYYYPADYRGDPREICLRNFRTFEWRTGLYTTYSGEKRLCPYLREAGPPQREAPPY